MAEWVYYEGQWFDKNPALTGPLDHAFWMSSVVFDGARAFGGLAPDLDLHCRRLLNSADVFGLEPALSLDEIIALCREGVCKFPREAELYIRPMFFGTTGFLVADPKGTKFTLVVYDMAMPGFDGFKACLSSYRRPARDQAPTDAKASCLYPNSSRALREANARGCDNAILLDANGNVAEFATANVWMAKDGIAHTPAANGTFLAGVTRQRIIGLLTGAGIEVQERAISVAELLAADEIFNTGNYGKVMPVIQFEDRDLQPGLIASKARELYFEYAKDFSVF